MLIITPNNEVYQVDPTVGFDDGNTVKIFVGRSNQSYDLVQISNIIHILNEAKKELEEGYNAVPRIRRENSDGTI